ncbi:MAG: GNAT family N-acetyltransferase [Erysipelotrichaceae bacterium]|nr:GNAT family N-acetyltransferase [Erysipelotrichaceae bacterium]
METIQNGLEFRLIRDYPHHFEEYTAYIIESWGNEVTTPLYQNHFHWMMKTDNVIPTWGVLMLNEKIIGCCGLIVNDFNSRMDVWPYLAAVMIDEAYRKQGLGTWMVKTMVNHGFDLGFKQVYCASDLFSFYKVCGFKHIGKTYHPWGENELFEISVS